MSSYLLFHACSISQSPCFLAIRDSKTDCSCWGVSNDDESSLAWIFSVQFRNSPSSICQKKSCQCSVTRGDTRSKWLLHTLCSLRPANAETVHYLLLGKEVFHLLFSCFAESIRFQRSKAIINSKIHLWHPVDRVQRVKLWLLGTPSKFLNKNLNVLRLAFKNTKDDIWQSSNVGCPTEYKTTTRRYWTDCCCHIQQLTKAMSSKHYRV